MYDVSGSSKTYHGRKKFETVCRFRISVIPVGTLSKIYCKYCSYWRKLNFWVNHSSYEWDCWSFYQKIIGENKVFAEAFGMITDMIMIGIIIVCTSKIRWKLKEKAEFQNHVGVSSHHQLRMRKAGHLAQQTSLLYAIPLVWFLLWRFTSMSNYYCTHGKFVTKIACPDAGFLHVEIWILCYKKISSNFKKFACGANLWCFVFQIDLLFFVSPFMLSL